MVSQTCMALWGTGDGSRHPVHSRDHCSSVTVAKGLPLMDQGGSSIRSGTTSGGRQYETSSHGAQDQNPGMLASTIYSSKERHPSTCSQPLPELADSRDTQPRNAEDASAGASGGSSGDRHAKPSESDRVGGVHDTTKTDQRGVSILARVIWGYDLRLERESRLAVVGCSKMSPPPPPPQSQQGGVSPNPTTGFVFRENDKRGGATRGWSCRPDERFTGGDKRSVGGGFGGWTEADFGAKKLARAGGGSRLVSGCRSGWNALDNSRYLGQGGHYAPGGSARWSTSDLSTCQSGSSQRANEDSPLLRAKKAIKDGRKVLDAAERAIDRYISVGEQGRTDATMWCCSSNSNGSKHVATSKKKKRHRRAM